jgi:hypothetical protein
MNISVAPRIALLLAVITGCADDGRARRPEILLPSRQARRETSR